RSRAPKKAVGPSCPLRAARFASTSRAKKSTSPAQPRRARRCSVAHAATRRARARKRRSPPPRRSSSSCSLQKALFASLGWNERDREIEERHDRLEILVETDA